MTATVFDFSISADNTAISVNAGASATSNLTISALYGFTGSVAFNGSCSRACDLLRFAVRAGCRSFSDCGFDHYDNWSCTYRNAARFASPFGGEVQTGACNRHLVFVGLVVGGAGSGGEHFSF